MTGPLNPPRSPVDWDRIGRYLAGESSPDEAAAVRHWLKTHPADTQLLAALENAAKQAATPEIDVDAALRKVKARAQTGARRTVVRFAAIGAIAAALALAAVLLPNRSRDVNDAAGQRIAFATQVGQRDSVRLPDGSDVVLGPDSRIQYATDAGQRTVELQGQAFFRVVHDARHPFIVRAGSATIRDIGTEFSVHYDPTEPVRVVVHEGIVEVVGVDSAVLRPGDVGIVGSNGAVAANRGAATADDLAWTEGRLVFRDTPVRELVEDLRRWYGVELRVTDSALLRRHYTGTFAGDSSRAVLDAIALALGARIERRGDTVFLSPTPRPSAIAR